MAGRTGRIPAPLVGHGLVHKRIEAKTFDQRLARDHVWDFKNLVQEAKDNFERGNRKRALDVWHTAQATFPDLAMTSEAALDLLVNMQRYDEAEALLSAGVKRHPKLTQ